VVFWKTLFDVTHFTPQNGNSYLNLFSHFNYIFLLFVSLIFIAIILIFIAIILIFHHPDAITNFSIGIFEEFYEEFFWPSTSSLWTFKLEEDVTQPNRFQALFAC
jgi:hypothetical protein